jgi:hypothetical protein
MKKRNFSTAIIISITALINLAVILVLVNITLLSLNTIQFSAEDPSHGNIDSVSVYKVKNYKSVYSQYNTYTHYSQLNQNEQMVYRAFEYALDNSFPYILIEDIYLEELTYSPKDILYLLSLDSPLVEQNLLNATDTFVSSAKAPFNKFFEEKKGTAIYISNFTSDKLAKKEKAISKAKEIIDTIPDSFATEEKKLEYIYMNLGDRLRYELYQDDDEKNYLYDALCMETSQCDGFANAFSLLCNMANIPCIEKISVPQREMGHTWNAFKLGDDWYNADLTLFKNLRSASATKLALGYEDALNLYDHLYEDISPQCNKNLNKIALHIDGGTISEISKKIKKAVKENTGGAIFITLADNMTGSQTFFNKIATELNNSFTYIGITGKEKKIFYLYGF